ncbi:MAG: hypothetical protein AAF591_18460, partial [Verrucomicrobiota bacterium]
GGGDAAPVMPASTMAPMSPLEQPVATSPSTQRRLLEMPTAPVGSSFRPDVVSCFEPGSRHFDIFPSVFLPDSGSSVLDDAWGAGIGASTFYNQIFGLSVDAIWWKPTSRSAFAISGSVVARFPQKALPIAPYIYGGFGGLFSDELQDGATGHLGGGLDVRFNRLDCIGIFLDARYTWADKIDNYAVVSGGLRFAF